jgi:DNA polymerase-1
LIVLDTETELFGPGRQFPPLVCVQTKTPEAGGFRLTLWSEARPIVVQALADPLLVGHYIAYDMGVTCAQWPDLIPLVFQAYREDRVSDTGIREKLIEIRKGNYQWLQKTKKKGKPGPFSLQQVAKRRLGQDIAKGEDTWRLRYDELKYTPVHAWPSEAVAYALEDVRIPELLWHSQAAEDPGPDEFRQSRADFWLALTSAWGLIADPAKVDALEHFIREEISEHEDLLKREGLIIPENTREARAFAALRPEDRPRFQAAKGWKRAAKLAQARALATNAEWPRTDPSKTHPEGLPQLSEEICEACTDPVLQSYGLFSSRATVLSKDVPLLRRSIVHSRYDLADSGRSTSYDPNVQNFKVIEYGPKDGPKFGIRECFRPRPGYIYVSADFGGLELCTFAQACLDLFGFSRMAELINAGLDCHLEIARSILGISYEEAKARKKELPVHLARQTGKVANFGIPGGLGVNALVEYAWGNYRVRLSEAEARRLKEVWFRSYPEGRPFFEYWGRLTESGSGSYTLPRSGRTRGRMRFTQASNNSFQGPGADIAKATGWAIAELCYVPSWRSALYGSRIVLFGHDEFLLESPECIAPECGEALSEVMTSTADQWLPGVKIKAEPQLHYIWTKSAETRRDESGRLIPWIKTT